MHNSLCIVVIYSNAFKFTFTPSTHHTWLKRTREHHRFAMLPIIKSAYLHLAMYSPLSESHSTMYASKPHQNRLEPRDARARTFVRS